jgi:hypothetical protein
MWLTASRVDPGMKDRVLGGSLWISQYHFLQLHPAWPIIKSQSIENKNVCSTWTHNLTMCCPFRICPSVSYLCFRSFPQFCLFFLDLALNSGESRVTPNRCTYTVPLFDQFSEKAFNKFMPEYLVPEIEYSTNLSQTRKIQISQHLLTCQAFGGCWRGLVPGVPPRRDSEGPRRGPLQLAPPSRRFQKTMTCSPRHR